MFIQALTFDDNQGINLLKFLELEVGFKHF